MTRNGLKMPFVCDWRILWDQCGFLYESVVVKMTNNLINICGGHMLAVCLALDHTLEKDNVALKDKLIQMLMDLKLMCKVYPSLDATVLEEHIRMVFQKSIAGTPYGERSVGVQHNTLEEAPFLEQKEQVRQSSQKMTFVYESLEEDFTYYQYNCGQEGRLKHNCLQTNN